MNQQHQALPMRVAMLHLGDPRGGIHRYGRTVADGLRGLPGIEVTECVASLAFGGPRGLSATWHAAGDMAEADIAVIPYTRYGLWATGATRVVQLLLACSRLRGKTVTVMHDLALPGLADRVEEISLRLIGTLSSAVVVHSEEQRARLADRGIADRVIELPHFVEERRLPDRAWSRRSLGLGPDDFALGMVGWIHPRKNCEAAVEALALLPANTRLQLIGSPPPGYEGYVQELLDLARERNVDDRLEVTGYVSEAELNTRLAALDVGVCPYRAASASASFATLLSAGLPIVGTDLLAFRAFSEWLGPLPVLVEQPTPEALSGAIRRRMGEGGAAARPSRPHASIYAPAAVAEAYVERVFRPVLAQRRRS